MSAPIERILVPLDAASELASAVDTAARLAARWQVPLHGLFVEDEDLLHLADLPFSRQASLGGAAEKLTAEHVGQHFRRAALRAYAILAAAAERHGVKWSFETVRGSPETLSLAASERDLVVACALTRPVGGHFRVECRWWSSVDRGRGSFLLTRQPAEANGPVLALLQDRTPAAVRLLEAAARLAAGLAAPLTVVAPPELASGEHFEEWLAEGLGAPSPPAQLVLSAADAANLPRQIAELGARVLVVAAATAPAELRRGPSGLACDLLFVR
jgi:hypothetical protein